MAKFILQQEEHRTKTEREFQNALFKVRKAVRGLDPQRREQAEKGLEVIDNYFFSLRQGA